MRPRTQRLNPLIKAVTDIGRSTARTRVLQDFCLFPDSLPWRLNTYHWQRNGIEGFLSNGVPHTATNSGTLSYQTAKVFLDHLMSSGLASELRDQRFAVVEFGCGLGLFARIFLDAFRDLCAARHVPHLYRNLRYFATDGSRSTVRALRTRRVFSEHEKTGILVYADAQAAGPFLSLVCRKGLRVVAIFTNYLLDTLPAHVLLVDSRGGLSALHLRTLLKGGDLRKTGRTMGIGPILTEGRTIRRHALAAVYPWRHRLEIEEAFRAIPSRRIPFSSLFVQRKTAPGARWVHSFGALRFVRACGAHLDRRGLIVIADYNRDEAARVASRSSFDDFGGYLAVGLNFGLLRHDAERRLGWFAVSSASLGDEVLHHMVLTPTPAPWLEQAVESNFVPADLESADAMTQKAMNLLRAGRRGECVRTLQGALENRPYDWTVLMALGRILVRHVKSHASGASVLSEALRLNPCYSADLHTLLGDAMFCRAKYREALEEYRKAVVVRPSDALAYYNEACALLALNDRPSARRSLGMALSVDTTGQRSDQILELHRRMIDRGPTS